MLSGILQLVCLGLSLTCLDSAVKGQEPKAERSPASVSEGPEVSGHSPDTVSVNSVLELQGFRINPHDSSKTQAYFLQNGKKYLARTGGGSGITNDEQHGAQTVDVIVPDGVVNGPSQVFIEVNGLRSVPVMVTIVDWKLPELRSISPTSGSPGTFVDIECPGLHTYDEIILTDALGKVTRFESGGSLNRTGFRVPKNVSEGVMTIQIGNSKYGNNQVTEPVKFVVTNDALPLELVTGYMTAVAPGQWLDLQAASLEPLKHSELTEVTFKQGGQSVIVSAPNPHRPHIGVPAGLTPGEVQLQVRTWRNGRSSVWSEPVKFQLTQRPVAPSVGAIRLEKSSWVHLWPGPDRPKIFRATAGDVIVINGSFPVADAKNIEVSLIGAGGAIDLIVSELDEKADWFSQVFVKLPDALEQGDWRMTVANADDGALVELPIVIRINQEK